MPLLWRSLILLSPLVLVVSIWGADIDSPVVSQMRRAVPGADRIQILKRIEASSGLDLIVVIAGKKDWPPSDSYGVYWDQKRTLGMFLQRRDHPGAVYKVAIEKGPEGCAARIERATATDIVISCSSVEGLERSPNRKYFYDLGLKALTGNAEYRPYGLLRLFPANGHIILVGTNHKQVVVLQDDSSHEHPFRLLTGQAAERWTDRVPSQISTIGSTSEQYLSLAPKHFRTLRFGPENRFALIAKSKSIGFQPASGFVVTEQIGKHTKQYPLPRSTYEDFAGARPERARNGYTKRDTEFLEEIGPSQVLEGNLWFAKTFYDGEGSSGLGGFGYFDATQRKFKIYSPPGLAYWSVDAMLVEPEAVWLGLASHGEYRNASGGLLRFDRKTEKTIRMPLPDLISGIARIGDRLIVTTDFGVALVEADGKLRRFFIDTSNRGQLQVSEATAVPSERIPADTQSAR